MGILERLNRKVLEVKKPGEKVQPLHPHVALLAEATDAELDSLAGQHVTLVEQFTALEQQVRWLTQQARKHDAA